MPQNHGRHDMEPITLSLVSLLASKGFSLLGDLINGASDKGIEKAKEFIEEKTGIPLVDSTGTIAPLTDEDLTKINEAVLEHKLELEKLLLEKDKAVFEDISDARDMQAHAVSKFADAVKTGNTFGVLTLWLNANFIHIFSLIILGATIYYTHTVTLTQDIPESRFQFITQASSFYQNILLIIVGYYFGGAFKGGNGQSSGDSQVPSLSTITDSVKKLVK